MTTAKLLYDKLTKVSPGCCKYNYTSSKCEEFIPLIEEINRLKKEKNAVILAHSYVSPEIVYTVADHIGDSYGLSKDAKNSDADIIVFTAVKFMAETAKILNPSKEVLVPNEFNGCSLADSITAEDIRSLKKQFPSYSFICYINTTAEVKAECDVCVTSSNVYDVIERFPSDKIYFVPDRLMGLNIIDEMKVRGVNKDIKLWNGTCYVHEDYKPEMVYSMKFQHDKLKVLAHPECDPKVIEQADFVGSTSGLLKYMKTAPDDYLYLMLTECGITSRLQVEMPEKNIVGSCTLCKYMRANTLEDILRVLTNPREQDRITLDKDIRIKALACVDKMFKYAEK